MPTRLSCSRPDQLGRPPGVAASADAENGVSGTVPIIEVSPDAGDDVGHHHRGGTRQEHTERSAARQLKAIPLGKDRVVRVPRCGPGILWMWTGRRGSKCPISERI